MIPLFSDCPQAPGEGLSNFCGPQSSGGPHAPNSCYSRPSVGPENLHSEQFPGDVHCWSRGLSRTPGLSEGVLRKSLRVLTTRLSQEGLRWLFLFVSLS